MKYDPDPVEAEVNWRRVWVGVLGVLAWVAVGIAGAWLFGDLGGRHTPGSHVPTAEELEEAARILCSCWYESDDRHEQPCAELRDSTIRDFGAARYLAALEDCDLLYAIAWTESLRLTLEHPDNEEYRLLNDKYGAALEADLKLREFHREQSSEKGE